MRKSLDAAGLAHIKTIAPDSWGAMWAIVADMEDDAELAAAVGVIGTHCPGYINGIPGDAHQPPPGTMKLGKPLWSTEQHIGERGLVGNASGVFAGDLPVWDWRAGLGIARVLNQGYLTANQTATLFWTPIYAWYEALLYGGKGLVVANTPWSGWYGQPSSLLTCTRPAPLPHARRANRVRTHASPPCDHRRATIGVQSPGTPCPTRCGWWRTPRSSPRLAGGSQAARVARC